jgi:cytochrome c oxidase subunit 2
LRRISGDFGLRIAYVVGALIFGSVLFHFITPWYFLPLASNWSSIDLAIDITFWVCGIVFIVINGFMVIAW